MIRKRRLPSFTTSWIAFVLVLFSVATFIPFYYVIAASFSHPHLVEEGKLLLLPKGFTLDAYMEILRNDKFVRSFQVTVSRTLLGLVVNLILQLTIAYALSKPYLPGRKYFMLYILITMLFNGGIIPTYLIVKNTGLIDTIWALVIPGAINAWNVILLRSFFEAVPTSLEESARMDGANDIRVFWSIYLPLSLPAVSTIGLFVAVFHWNSFMDAVIYLNSYDLQVLQIYLRDMVVMQEVQALLGDSNFDGSVSSLSLRTASVFLSTLPIVLLYPFIQKYFIKGVMIGAVKG